MTISEDKDGATVSAAGNVTAQEPTTDQQEGATTKPAATEMYTNASELSSMTTAGPGKPQDASEVAASSADDALGSARIALVSQQCLYENCPQTMKRNNNHLITPI